MTNSKRCRYQIGIKVSWSRGIGSNIFRLLLCLLFSSLIFAFSPNDVSSPTRFLRNRIHICHSIGKASAPVEGTPYFVRKSLMADLGYASKILADGFYGDANMLTYQFERLQTYLSLESTFPKINEQHEMFSLCRSDDGRVLAFCEIDNRPTNTTKTVPRPYMCNLAVDLKWRGGGFAKVLVRTVEEQAISWEQCEVYLKVMRDNKVAVSLYSSLGYKVISQEFDEKKRCTLLLMKKNLGNAEKVLDVDL